MTPPRDGNRDFRSDDPLLAGARELNDAEKEAVRAETHRYAKGDAVVEAELNRQMGAEK
jgi:hypothetical protein